MRYIRCIL